MKKRFFLLLLSIAVLCVLSGCGDRREIDDNTIISYLEESYFTERGLSIDELSDITESETESAQKRSVTCTTEASGELCSQIANWTVTFEKLGDEWVGIEKTEGVSNVTLNEPSEKCIMSLVQTFAEDGDQGDHFYLEDSDVNIIEQRIELSVREYTNYYYYVNVVGHLLSYAWNDYGLTWQKVDDNKADPFVILKYDISGSYETEECGTITISRLGDEYYIFAPKYNLENQKLDFRRSNGKVGASIGSSAALWIDSDGKLKILRANVLGLAEIMMEDVSTLPETDWKFPYHYKG